MANLTEKEKIQRTPWLLIGLLVANFALMAYDAREQDTKQRVVRSWAQAIAAPVQQLVTSVGGTGFTFFQEIAAMRNAVAENEALRQQISTLQAEIVAKQNFEAENERLRGLLELKNTSQTKIIPAQVIGRDPSAWFDTVIINRGQLSGIDLSMPVVTSEGVVGRVVAVSAITSQVQLLSDDKSGVYGIVGQIGTSNAFGSIRGTGGRGLLEMRYVPGTEIIEIGAIVTTTGQDGIYPPGLKIGEVAEVRAGSITAPQTVYIKQSAKIEGLQEVGVVLYRAPEKPAFEKSLQNVENKPKT